MEMFLTIKLCTYAKLNCFQQNRLFTIEQIIYNNQQQGIS